MAEQQAPKGTKAPEGSQAPAATGQSAKAVLDMEYTPLAQTEKIKLSIHIVKTMLCVPTKKGVVCDDTQAMKFMMMCRARMLNPFEGDAFLIGYDEDGGKATFSLITSHQAFLKRAEIHPQYDGMESGVIVRTPDGDMIEREGDFFLPGDDKTPGEFLLGGWAKVYVKNRSKPTYRRLNLLVFHTGYSRWKKDPAGMIVKCAEADSLRSSFPTYLGGLYLAEELRGDDDTLPAPTPPVGKITLRETPAEEVHPLGNGHKEKETEPVPVGAGAGSERPDRTMF